MSKKALLWIPAQGSAFNPTSLFTGGVTGGWWNPSDTTTTFQDTTGLVPATADGNPVLRINDKSGNGNNLLAGGPYYTAPVLRNSGSLWWLEFNFATYANIQSLSAAFTHAQPVTRITAGEVVIYVPYDTLWSGGNSSHGAISERVTSPELTLFGGSYLIVTSGMTVGANHVLTEIWNGSSSSLAVDDGSAVTGDGGTDDIAGQTLLIQSASGGNATNFYGGISIGRVLTGPETSGCLTFFGNLAGLSL